MLCNFGNFYNPSKKNNFYNIPIKYDHMWITHLFPGAFLSAGFDIQPAKVATTVLLVRMRND